jgi:hypothetical protein
MQAPSPTPGDHTERAGLAAVRCAYRLNATGILADEEAVAGLLIQRCGMTEPEATEAIASALSLGLLQVEAA